MNQRTGWIVVDFTLATLIAVAGNIVASYLQERFDLTDPIRFTFVAVVFVVCFGLLLFVTLKQSNIKKNHQVEPIRQATSRPVSVRQWVQQLRGQLTGAHLEKMSAGEVLVDQTVDTIYEGGKATALEVKELSGGNVSTNQTVEKVNSGGTVIGANIDRLG